MESTVAMYFCWLCREDKWWAQMTSLLAHSLLYLANCCYEVRRGWNIGMGESRSRKKEMPDRAIARALWGPIFLLSSPGVIYVPATGSMSIGKKQAGRERVRQTMDDGCMWCVTNVAVCVIRGARMALTYGGVCLVSLRWSAWGMREGRERWQIAAKGTLW